MDAVLAHEQRDAKAGALDEVVIDSANPVPKAPTIQLLDWKSKSEE
mgnify:CR=1 FL=1